MKQPQLEMVEYAFNNSAGSNEKSGDEAVEESFD